MSGLWKNIILWYNLRKLKKIKPKHEDAALVYTDSQGNKWYTVSPSSLHATRALTAWVLTKDLDYGLTRDKLLNGFKKINELINKGNITDASKVLGVLEAAMDLYCEPEVLLNIATCYTFLNDEPEEYKEHIQKKKKDIFEKDYECKSFFLSYAISYTKKFSQSPPPNAQEYFQEVKPLIDQINYHLTQKPSTMNG